MHNSSCTSAPAELSLPNKDELQHKLEAMQQWMDAEGLQALLLSRHENIAWAAGGIDVRIGVLRETGAASLLVLSDGRRFYLAGNNEQLRMAEEEFAGRGFEPVIRPWFAADHVAMAKEIAGPDKLGCDMPMPGKQAVSLLSLRQTLTEAEVERYRWLGQAVAEEVTSLLKELRPGLTEHQIQGMLSDRLLRCGILPSVYLTSTDQRALRYRHPVPRHGTLQQFGMVGMCARRWGLTAAITRFVHFGKPAENLLNRFHAVAHVHAALLHGTRAGVSSDALFQIAAQAHAAAGFHGEEQAHHQGGPTGYLEREWIARPGGMDTVQTTQAFAWNPTIQGAKAEDTHLLRNGSIERLTETPGLPEIAVTLDGNVYKTAAIHEM